MQLSKRVIEIIQKEGVIGFIKLLLKFIISFFYLPYCAFKISQFKTCHDLNKLVDFSFSVCQGFIKPIQDRFEIIAFLEILKKMRPKYVLEIGTAFGGTLFLFARVASEHAHIISIDIGGWGVRGGYPVWKKPFYKLFALSNQKIRLLRMDSHAEITLKKVKAILNGEKLDLLFIDGDHSYQGAKIDFEMYAPLVRRKGLVAFHDIVGFSEGISKFWNEMKKDYEYSEFSSNGGGIGVIEK